jgi:polysaccharide biosynthesis/export protein
MNRSYLVCGLLIVLVLTIGGCISKKPQSSPIVPMALAEPATTQEELEPGDYIIKPGDQLEIKFYYNSELNDTIPVRPDGKISLQLIDDMQAAGLTPHELDNELTQAYAEELKSPEVTVIVRSFSTNSVWVGGEVNQPGLIPISNDMSPLHAVFSAGGFLESAKPEAALIIRKGADNRPVPITVDLSAVMKGVRKGQSIQRLEPNDIVYIPKSAIAEANKFVHQYIENLLLFRGVNLGFSYEIRGDNNNN